MASSSNLPSKFFNSIYINRLQALNSKVSNFNDPTPNFLFSILFNDATLNKHPDKATLSFTSSNISSIIQFTDRPLRQSKTISSEDFLSLFNVDNSGFNSFAEDPPNGVLVHNKEQKTYEIKSIKRDGSEIKFEMLYVSETGQLGEFSGKMSFFIDMSWAGALRAGALKAAEQMAAAGVVGLGAQTFSGHIYGGGGKGGTVGYTGVEILEDTSGYIL